METLEPLYTVGGKAVENSMEVPQNIPNRMITGSSNPTYGYIPQNTESRDFDRCSYIHVRNLHNSQWLNCGSNPSVHRPMSGQANCGIRGYDSALKRKKILTYATV